MTQDELKVFLREKIYHWVGKNFGTQEADDPSWDIKTLSEYLAKEVYKKNFAVKDLQPEELTVLIRTDADAQKEIDRITHQIKELGGDVISVENDGTKRLAYNINGQEYAEYVYINLGMPKEKVVALSTWLNIQDNVLRYLLVRQDTRR